MRKDAKKLHKSTWHQ